MIKAGANAPFINLYSDEISLIYLRLSVIADETNSGEFTKLENGAKALAAGETIAFKVQNTSTYDNGPVEFDAVVYAERNGERTELYRQSDLSLAYGETGDTISFRSWDADLAGTYDIIAAAESSFII